MTVEAASTASVSNSSINEGGESAELSLISPVITIAGTKLGGDISLDAGSSSTEKKITIEECSVNDSGSGTLTVTGGTLSVDKSSLAGDITIEKSVSGAKITSSTIDTSTGSNALRTGTDITIEGSTVAKGSGLYVIPTPDTTVKVSISSSTSDDGEEITNQTMRSIVNKELTDDEVNKGDVIYPWSSGGSCSVDDDTVPETRFFTLKSNDGNTYTFHADKGVEITLSDYVQSRGSSYVGPTFYSDSDSDYTNEIQKIKLTGDNKYIVTSPSTDTTEHSGNIITKWEYKVSFDLDGGSGNTTTATTENNGKLTIADPSKTNCSFAGWYDASDSTKTVISSESVSDNSTVTLTQPTTLKAKWSATVTFVTNGGSVAESQSVTCGEKITTLPTVTKDRCLLGGWYKDENLTKEFNKDSDVITENTTLYAKWRVRVTVTIGSKSKDYDVGETIEAGDEYLQSRIGDVSYRKFKGWYTDKACNTAADFPITLSDDTVLYPLYECEVTIKQGEGETLTGSEGTLSFREGTTITTAGFFNKTENSYIKKYNRNFAGWYTVDKSGNEVEVTSSTLISSNITIYAKWNVSYSIGDSTSEVVVAEGSTIKISELTQKRKNEYSFIESVKWYDAAPTVSGRKAYGSEESVVITRVNQKFYPEDEYYMPTLSSTDSKDSNKEILGRAQTGSMSVDSNGKLTLPTLASTNYKFEGWYKGEEKVGDGGATDYVVSSADQNVTLTPKWTIKKFTVTFDANGGTSSPSSEKVEYGDSISEEELNDVTITKNDRSFDGWYENSSKVTSLTDISSNITIYAKWNVSYSIGDSTTKVVVAEGTAVEISELTEKRKEKYSYIESVKWYDDAPTVSERKEYGSDESVVITRVNQKFYPEDEYYIKLSTTDTKDSSKEILGRAQTGSMSVDSNGKLTLPTLSSTNYKFEGWYNGDTLVGNGGETAHVVSAADKEVTLTPKWTIKKFTVTFNADGGTSNPSSKEVEYGDSISEEDLKAVTATKSDCKFAGWYTEDESENKVDVTSLSDISSNITIYAKWNVSYSIGDSTAEVVVAEGSTIKISELTQKRKNEYSFIESVKWYDAADTGSERKAYGSEELVVITRVNQKFYPEDAYYMPTLSSTDTKDSNKEILGRAQTGSMSVDSNGKLTLPTLASTNYKFEGWYKGEEKVGDGGATDYVVSSADQNVTLTPKWTIRKFTVTFDANDGTSNPSLQEVEYGDTITDLGDPTKSGCIFNGWYEGDNKVTSLSNITADHTLNAKWKRTVKINEKEYSLEKENAVITLFNSDVTYLAIFEGNIVYTYKVADGQQFDYWLINGKKVSDGSNTYKYTVEDEKEIIISTQVSTKEGEPAKYVNVTVQNHYVDGEKKTDVTYTVAYGTTIGQLIKANCSRSDDQKLQENNMRYAIEDGNNITLYSSIGTYAFTQDTTVKQACYITILSSDKTQQTDGWVYCGDKLTAENFTQYGDNKAITITNDVINKLIYNRQQTGTSYESKFDSAIALTQDVNLIIKSGT